MLLILIQCFFVLPGFNQQSSVKYMSKIYLALHLLAQPKDDWKLSEGFKLVSKQKKPPNLGDEFSL